MTYITNAPTAGSLSRVAVRYASAGRRPAPQES
ncbi:MAG: hypothetical protein JWP90_379 [Mycetocola sp.]|jgi:hypothetical protein|nr:hypothetical protein [Mycetocola sp.]MCU1559426.1 hypothetical protein [Mycetocola sp.]